ncbi:MAG: hypothetical protein HUU50_04685 [Candidatus Brocadiae bacterium]|nr:hypothetical protein [Candidatus Brocadiia bacterium]
MRYKHLKKQLVLTQKARWFYLKRSLRVSLLSGIKKTGIPFFFVPGSRVESNSLICQAVLFLIPYRRLTLRSSYP